MNNSYFILLAILFGLSCAANFFLYTRFEDEHNYRLYHLGLNKPFKKKKRIISNEEAKLNDILSNIDSLKNFFIYPQIPYSAILEVDSEIADLNGRFEKINEYRADFVIVNKNDFSPVLIIELNDSTHKYKNRRARDYFITSALESCEIPLIFIETKDLPNIKEIEQKIERKLNSHHQS